MMANYEIVEFIELMSDWQIYSFLLKHLCLLINKDIKANG